MRFKAKSWRTPRLCAIVSREQHDIGYYYLSQGRIMYASGCDVSDRGQHSWAWNVHAICIHLHLAKCIRNSNIA